MEGLGQNPKLERPPVLYTCVDLPETANLRGRYFCGAAIQCASKLLVFVQMNQIV